MNEGELSKRIDDLHKRFDDLRSDMNARFALMDKRLDDLRGEMIRRFEELTGRMGRLARLEDRVWWIAGIQIGTWITIMLAILFRR
jgi:hypothetical protein